MGREVSSASPKTVMLMKISIHSEQRMSLKRNGNGS
jgi:hypothetical protein